MSILVDDTELRAGFKRGDNIAMKSVYRAYVMELFQFLKKGFVIRSADGTYFFKGYEAHWQLEAAVQDVFSKAFSASARDSYDGLRPYKNYLFTIARNYVIDRFRASKTRKEFLVPMSDADGELASAEAAQSVENAETLLQDAELRVLIKQFVEGLSKKDATIFKLRFKDRVSIEVASKGLGMTEYRVKATERAIRKRFYDLMQQHGYLSGYTYEAPGTRSTVLLLLALWSCRGGR